MRGLPAARAKTFWCEYVTILARIGQDARTRKALDPETLISMFLKRARAPGFKKAISLGRLIPQGYFYYSDPPIDSGRQSARSLRCVLLVILLISKLLARRSEPSHRKPVCIKKPSLIGSRNMTFGMAPILIVPFKGGDDERRDFENRSSYFWKIALGTNAWMPLTPSTAWVTTRSIVALSNM